MDKLYMNRLSYEDILNFPEIVQKVWLIHNLPEMQDCRDLNYFYIFKDNKIFCDGEDIDITEEVESYNYWELKYKYEKEHNNENN